LTNHPTLLPIAEATARRRQIGRHRTVLGPSARKDGGHQLGAASHERLVAASAGVDRTSAWPIGMAALRPEFLVLIYLRQPRR
jgi:hypothetical protein